MDYTGQLATAATGIQQGLIYLLVFAVIGVACFIAWLFLQYNIRVRVKEITGGRKIIHDTRARLLKKEKKLKIWAFNEKAPLPPASAINVTKKGKKYVEAYYINNQYIYATDNITAEHIEYEPLKTDDREFYLNEMREAEERKGFDWKANIPLFAGMAVLVIIFVITLVYWGDIMQPSIKMQDQNAKIATQNAQTAESLKETTIMLREIMKQEQVIRDKEVLPPE